MPGLGAPARGDGREVRTNLYICIYIICVCIICVPVVMDGKYVQICKCIYVFVFFGVDERAHVCVCVLSINAHQFVVDRKDRMDRPIVPYPHNPQTPSHQTNPKNKNRPFFLWRGWPCVDGSILAGRKDVPPHLREHEHVTFDYVEDEALR